MTARAKYSVSPTYTGHVVGDEFRAEVFGLLTHVVISSGPMMPSGWPGKFSTLDVVITPG